MAEVDFGAEVVEEAKEEVMVKESQMMKDITKCHFTVITVENQATKKHIVGKSKRMRSTKSMLLRKQRKAISSLWLFVLKQRSIMTFGFWTVGIPIIFLEANLDSGNLMSPKSEVTLGDNKNIQVEGRGNVSIMTSKGNTKILQDPMLVPSLSHNLLSIRKLMTSGYSTLFDDGHCVIRDKTSDHVIAKVPMAPRSVYD